MLEIESSDIDSSEDSSESDNDGKAVKMSITNDNPSIKQKIKVVKNEKDSGDSSFIYLCVLFF